MRLVPATLIALATALPLRADPLAFGAELKLQLGHNSRPINYKRLEASFTSPGDWRYGAQIDLSIGKFESFQSAAPGGALHLYRNLGDAGAVGLFLAAEDRRTINELFIGAEAKYDFGRFEAEGYVAKRKVIRAAWSGTGYGLDLGVDLDRRGRVQLLAGHHGSAGSDFSYLGGAYDFQNGIRMELQAGRNDSGETITTIAARFKLGDGATFRRRGFLAGSPAQ